MELTVPSGLPATSAGLPAAPPVPGPAQGQMPAEPSSEMPVAVASQPDWAQQQWPPQPWTGQGLPQQMPPQGWVPQQMPPQGWQGGSAMPPPLAMAPGASVMPGVAVARKKSAGARAVDVVFGLSLLIAVGGVAFAVGRATAPPSTATGAARAGLAGLAGRTGTGTGTGQGTGGTGQNAIVVPQASGAPGAVGQQAAQSGAPVIPGAGTGTGSGTGTTGTGTTGTGTGTGTGAGTGSGTGAGTTSGRQGGFGARAGLTGTVSAIGDGTISYTTATGATTEVATTETTTYHQQTPATAADVVVGSSVRITVEGGFGGGRPGGVAPAASAAPGAAPATTRPTATDIQVLPASDAGSATTTTGPERGFGRGGLTGTVTAVGDGTVNISTAGGQTIDVATTSTTTYHGEATATAADVVVGSSIRVTAAGGFGGGLPAAPGASPAAAGAGTVTASITASDVEVLLPAGQ